jgi:hypothetical protein
MLEHSMEVSRRQSLGSARLPGRVALGQGACSPAPDDDIKKKPHIAVRPPAGIALRERR